MLRELRILLSCDSPFIVRFFGCFFAEGKLNVCLEFMDGGSLHALNQAAPPGGCPPAVLHATAFAVTCGLQYMNGARL